MRPWDYSSLGRFVPGRFVTICPQFSGRTIHPHFEQLENLFGRFIPDLLKIMLYIILYILYYHFYLKG
jgi:hypothetical protein